MATGDRTEPPIEEIEGALLSQIEVHSIDWIPDRERHGKNWQQSMLWFLGNFQYFTIPIGFVGPLAGLSLGWSILAGFLGIAFGTLFMAFHATQGPVFGLPQMIQTRAQLGYRGVVVALFAVLFTYMAFNVADQVLLASGLNGAFGWNATLVAIVTAFLSATALLATMGMNAYGGMLTVLTGIDSFKTLKTSRAWRAVTVIALAIVWYAIGAGISTSGSSTAVTAVLN